MFPFELLTSEASAANLLQQIRWRDAWLSPHRGVSKDKLTPYLRAFQLRRQILRKPGQEALKEIVRTLL